MGQGLESLLKKGIERSWCASNSPLPIKKNLNRTIYVRVGFLFFYTRIQNRFEGVSLPIRNAFCFVLNQYLPSWNRVKNDGVLKTTWCKTAVCDGCFLNAKKKRRLDYATQRAYSQGVVVYSLIKSGKQCKQKRIEVDWLFPLRALFWKDYREERNLFIFTPSCCSSCLRRGDVIKLFISPWKMYDGIKSDRYCDLRNRITCGKQ